jgi:hypothetical protein
MIRATDALIFCLFICLPFSTVPGTENPLAHSQNPSSCLSYEPSVVELTGTIVRQTSTDGQDRPETYWLLELPQPICVNQDPAEPDMNYAQEDVRSIQLAFPNGKMYTTYKALLGKKVIAKGTLFVGMTAHHHTPVLLTVSTLKMAA